MARSRGKPKGIVHLLRGSLAVRSWSRYQVTVERWTLCGIERHKGDAAIATEDPAEVQCRFCLILMRPRASAGVG